MFLKGLNSQTHSLGDKVGNACVGSKPADELLHLLNELISEAYVSINAGFLHHLNLAYVVSVQ